MNLPNPERAFVDIAKLRDYCLSPGHEHGKHKARVFASALGVDPASAGWLRDRLIEAARGDAKLMSQSEFGSLYVIDFEVRTSVGQARLRSGWIVKSGEDFARLTTCFVKRNS